MDMLGGVRQGLLNANFQDIALLDVSLSFWVVVPRPSCLGVEVRAAGAAGLVCARVEARGTDSCTAGAGRGLGSMELADGGIQELRKGCATRCIALMACLLPPSASRKMPSRSTWAKSEKPSKMVGHTYLALFMEPAGGEGGIAIPEALRGAEVLMDRELERHLDERVPKR